jgi:hypothetical protein
LGWRIHRIWSTDWWLNPEVEVEKLVRRLQELLASDEPDSEEPQVAEEQATTPSIATNFEAPVAKNAPRDAAASYDVPTSAGISAVALPVYSPAILPIGNSNMFYEPSTGQALAEQIRQVVEVLYRRVARAWGLERTGSRIVERLRNLVPSDLGRTSEGGTTFYWPASVDRSSWKSFRLANNEESSRRRVDDVCIEELGNLVLHVLDVGGSAPRQDVSKSVCRLLGMARTPADAEARVQLSIDALLHLGVLADVGGSLRKTT